MPYGGGPPISSLRCGLYPVLSSAAFCKLSISPSRDEAAVAVREQVYGDAKRAAVFGLGVNLLLAIAKIVGGVLTASSALIADAVNSIGDVTSALAVRGALAVAERAEDADHPYGHTKAESIAGLCVSLLVAFGAVVLGVETVKRFFSPQEIPSMAAGVVAACSAVVKEIAFRYTNRVAKRLDSSALRATAVDHRSDALGSGAVAISLFAAPYLGSLGPYVDPLAGLVVCALLLAVSVSMFRSIAREIMDQQADGDFVDQVRQVATKVNDVSQVEKLRVRKSGLEYFVEIHVQVAGDLTVSEGHRIGHEVKDRVLLEMPRVRDVHVHIEPYHECASPTIHDTSSDDRC